MSSFPERGKNQFITQMHIIQEKEVEDTLGLRSKGTSASLRGIMDALEEVAPCGFHGTECSRQLPVASVVIDAETEVPRA